MTLQTHRNVVADGLDVDIVKDNVVCTDEEGSPAGRVEQGDAGYLDIRRVIGQEEDRSVLKNLVCDAHPGRG